MALAIACGSNQASSPSDSGAHQAGSAGNGSPSAEGGEPGTSSGGTSSGGSSEGGGSSSGEGGTLSSDACPNVPDPGMNCPADEPTSSTACVAGAICYYDSCSNGCGLHAFCPDVTGAWHLASTLCGGSCTRPVATEDPWSKPHSLDFARIDGGCGKLGELDYDPVSNKLGASDCTTVLDKVSGCEHHRTLSCVTQGTTLGLEMVVAFRAGSGWSGRTIVNVTGASSCHGEYNVALSW